MTSSSNSTTNPSLVQPTEKLSDSNNTIWYAQVHAVVRGAKLMGYLTSESKAPPIEIPKIGTDHKEILTDDKRVLRTRRTKTGMQWTSKF
jgi:hypothetical protein